VSWAGLGNMHFGGRYTSTRISRRTSRGAGRGAERRIHAPMDTDQVVQGHSQLNDNFFLRKRLSSLRDTLTCSWPGTPTQGPTRHAFLLTTRCPNVQGDSAICAARVTCSATFALVRSDKTYVRLPHRCFHFHFHFCFLPTTEIDSRHQRPEPFRSSAPFLRPTYARHDF
jgi:hypothetical protein